MAAFWRPAALGRICGLTLATLLVLFALGVSLIRSLLPQLEQARDKVTDYLWENYRIEVKVSRLAAEWQAFGPSLTVENLILPPQEGLPLTLIIKRTDIKLDFWQTLISREPTVEHVAFEGVQIALDLDAMGGSGPQEPIPASNDTARVKESTRVIDWLSPLLLEQLQQFALTDATVQLKSKHHDFRPIYVGDLRWLNLDGRHRAEGYVYLDDRASVSERLSLQIDLKGDGSQPESIHGQLYLAARALDLGEWAARQPNPFNETEPLPLAGVVNFEAWADVADLSLMSALVQFSPSYVQWPGLENQQRFAVDGGSLVWQRHGRGWLFGSDQLALVSNDMPWPEARMAAMYDGVELKAELDALDLGSLSPLVPLIPGLTIDGLKTLLAMHPQGQLQNMRLHYKALQSTAQQDATHQLAVSAGVSGLGWLQVGHIPGLKQLDAKLFFDGELLRASLPAQTLEVDFGTQAFKAPLVFQTPGMELGFDVTENALLAPSVQLENPDLAVDAAMKMVFSQPTHLALSAGVEVRDAARAGYYFPRAAMGNELADYLEGAIIAGRTRDAAVVWNGALKDFPYRDSSGIFQAGFVMDEASYAFQPDWPAVTDLSLRALFENLRMDIWVDEGKLKAVNAAGAHVYIPEMSHETVLHVEAALATTGPAATAVLQSSPLKHSVGAVLDVVKVQGAVKGDLDLVIPLYHGGKPDIQGLVLFDDTPVYLDTPGVQLNRLKGELRFANDRIEAGGLSARLFGQPLSLDVFGADGANGYRVDTKLKSGWDLASLPPSLDNPLSDFYAGVLAWQGTLALTLPKTGGFDIKAEAESSLRNAELKLPPPFAKNVGVPMPLKLALQGNGDGLTLDVFLDNKGHFAGHILPSSGTMDSFLLTLADSLASPQSVGVSETISDSENSTAPENPGAAEGAGDSTVTAAAGLTQAEPESTSAGDATQHAEPAATQSASVAAVTSLAQSARSATGGHLDVTLRQASFNDWLPIIMGFVDSSTAEPTSDSAQQVSPDAQTNPEHQPNGFFPRLEGIYADIGELTIFGQSLADALIFARPEDGLWRVSTDANEFSGDIDLFPDWHSGGIKLRASKLYLSPEFTEAEAETSVLGDEQFSSNLPPIAVDVDDFRLYDRALGHLVLQGLPEPGRYNFQTLSLSSDAATLKGQGGWLMDVNQTRMEFSLKADKFDALALQLGITPGIKDSPLDISAELYWQGAPHEFDLGTLSGGLKFALGKGSLTEISDKGARIFSLFSLDSLLRKLSLDFTDVFGKGMFYNSFAGTLELDNGVVKTRDTEMDAIAGNMKVRGYTDLTTQSLNYDIRFVPQLASSVPTVVLLSTSAWTMGLGAFALTKVLEPVIEVISEIRFRLSGTMTDPMLEELERKSKEIEIPESVLPRPKEAPATSADGDAPVAQGGPEPTPAAQSGPEQQAPEQAKPESVPESAPVNDPVPEQTEEPEPEIPETPLTGEPEPLSQLPGTSKPVQLSHYLRRGDPHAGQFAAMPEQPGCAGQSGLYRIAA
ncbi:YhdP family protein [Shewanella sp. FJAT-52076]|uniref:YhdP family protein n=1 Tax=Shewanella sp. FJAT-52076 TaxID=2864202 RepID=UPI0021ACD9EB|nr:YhdP family protein [Shewanella sp. FJAT-52076]